MLSTAGMKIASQVEGSNGPDNAFDGQPATAWLAPAANAVGSYIEINLDQPMPVAQIRLRPKSDDYMTAPTSFEFQYFDGSNWVSAGQGAYQWPSGFPRSYAFNIAP